MNLETYIDPDVMSLFGWCSELHLTLRSRDNDTVLMNTWRHRVRVQNRPNVFNVSCTARTFSDSKISRNRFHIPLFALDSDTAEEPGSAELQYKVRV